MLKIKGAFTNAKDVGNSILGKNNNLTLASQ